MSYRLIDANALAANCKQVNDMPCIYADLPNGLDGNHYIVEQSESNRESRWFELFGTPERAAVTLVRTSDERAVCKLPTWTASSNDYEAWLDWLRGDA